MITLFTLVALFLSANAQLSENNTALQLQAIQAHFKQGGLTPTLLPKFNPIFRVFASFDIGVLPGQLLNKSLVQVEPRLDELNPNSTSLPTTFTVAMVDFGAVGSDQSAGQTRHWLVNGVTLDNGTFKTDNATVITKYAGPAPPAGSGPHRYTILVYVQPPSFTAPPELSSLQPVGKFDINNYASSSKLGDIAGGTYFNVEEGTATASISATSAVVTSTLPAFSSTSAGGAPAASPSTGSTGNAFNNQALSVANVLLASTIVALIV